MIFQLYDRDENPYGLLRTNLESGLYANKIEAAAKTIWDHLSPDGYEHPGDEFWDALIEALAKMDIVAERVFTTEINL